MPSRRRLPSALPLAALALLALTGCGGGDERASAVTQTTTVTRTVTTPPPATTTGTGTTTTPGGQGAIDPDAPLTLQTAEQTLDRHGYATLTERDFRPDQRLKVLIGVRRGVSDAGAQLAFFFVGDRFIGTDSTATSGRIAVTAQQDDAITLTYSLYRTGDTIDGPTGGSADVTFRWNGSALEPQSTIPTADPLVSPSRR